MIRKRTIINKPDNSLLTTNNPPKNDSDDDNDDNETINQQQLKKKQRTIISIPIEEKIKPLSTILNGDDAVHQSTDTPEKNKDKTNLSSSSAVVDVNPNDLIKPKSKFGPTTAPVYMRATTIVDYNPEVCKDFKETGFCGYGDSCIYIHDRSNYLDSSQLDKKWEEINKSKKIKNNNSSSNNKSETTEMHGCPICRKLFSEGQPLVKTKCGHIACRSCALERFQKIPTCAACGSATQGIFNDYKYVVGR
jgi:hypothetical protein